MGAGLWRDRQLGWTFVSCAHAIFSVCLFTHSSTSQVLLIVNIKVVGLLKYAETGWEKGVQSRARFYPQPSAPTVSRLTRKQGYASPPAFWVVSPSLTFFLAPSCGIFPWYENIYIYLTGPFGVPLDAQIGTCSRMSSTILTANTTMGILYLTADVGLPLRKYGV